MFLNMLYHKTKFTIWFSLIFLVLSLFFSAPASQAASQVVIQFENQPLFNEANFVPGDTVTRWVKVDNQSTDSHQIGVQATDFYNCSDPVCLADALDLVIEENGAQLYHSSLTNFFNAGEISLSSVAAGQQTQYDFKITFLPDSNNDYQGLTTHFDFEVGTILEDNGNGDNGGGGGGGGGGFTSHPRLTLTTDYPTAKTINISAAENVTLTNNGNIVLTHGVLTIDLPEDKLSFISATPNWNNINTTTGVAEWQISALGIGSSYTVSFNVNPLLSGQALSDVNAVFDQASAGATLTETISAGNENTGGGTTGGGGPTGGVPTGGGTTGGTGGGPLAGIVAGQTTTGNQINTPTTPPASNPQPQPQVKGANAAQACQTPACPWWVWLIAVILHLITLILYPRLVKKDALEQTEENKNTVSGSAASAETSYQSNIKYLWLWWDLVIISLLIIYLLFTLVCALPALVLAVILGVYLLSLILHHLITVRGKLALWPFVPLALAIAPIASYLYCSSWPWWLWLLVLVTYALTVIYYYLSIIKVKLVKNWYLALSLMTLLIIILELSLYLCLPCLK